MTTQAYLVQALINFLAVAGGLFVLWSLVGGMRRTPVAVRAWAAIFAGVVSALATVVVTAIIVAVSS